MAPRQNIFATLRKAQSPSTSTVRVAEWLGFNPSHESHDAATNASLPISRFEQHTILRHIRAEERVAWWIDYTDSASSHQIAGNVSAQSSSDDLHPESLSLSITDKEQETDVSDASEEFSSSSIEAVDSAGYEADVSDMQDTSPIVSSSDAESSDLDDEEDDKDDEYAHSISSMVDQITLDHHQRMDAIEDRLETSSSSSSSSSFSDDQPSNKDLSDAAARLARLGSENARARRTIHLRVRATGTHDGYDAELRRLQRLDRAHFVARQNLRELIDRFYANLTR